VRRALPLLIPSDLQGPGSIRNPPDFHSGNGRDLQEVIDLLELRLLKGELVLKEIL
jgi:hypothetical protein